MFERSYLLPCLYYKANYNIKMKNSIPLKCKCGNVQGRAKNISPKTGKHIVCLCDDCQTFAHYLGNPNEILDANGGTHIFQITPAQVEITKGHQHLACLQLSPKGARRWFTSCCKTPVANTGKLKMAFNGVIQNFMDFENADITKEKALGPIVARCMGEYGKGELPKGTYKDFPKGLVFKIGIGLLLGRITKSYLPNSFFDKDTGRPVVKPIIMSKEERLKLKSQL
jgi:hypothetical protein